MASKFYAVKKGKIPGIYNSWDDCKKMVDGFPGAVYKSIQNHLRKRKPSWVQKAAPESGAKKQKNQIQGSRNKIRQSTPLSTVLTTLPPKSTAYGGFLIHNGEKEVLQGSGNDAEMASMRNVSGEILGAMAAVERAIELKLPEVTIYYDYMGIEMWAEGAWKRNRQGTIAYYEYMQSAKNKIRIKFVKVKGHSGVDGNEEADQP